jgi:putative SOS response-associated peptidase YedK
MCGRFALRESAKEVEAVFGYPDGEPFPPRYNIAPTQPIATVRQGRQGRSFALARWGLIPAWVKDPAHFSLLFNARSEGIHEKPAFRGAVQYRRCLVPASGFYEWRRQGRGKQPWWIAPKGQGPIAFAGIWETWSGPDGNEIDTACIVTTEANATLAPIHPRMPVIIAPDDFDAWLSADLAIAANLLRPAPDDQLAAIQVSDRVNSADADDPALVEPVIPMKSDLFE